MSYSAAEIETIVRRVLSSLSAEGTTAVQGDIASRAGSTNAKQLATSAALQLSESVITAQLLKGRLKGVTEVLVSMNAVITPAAKDLCREAKAAIVRGSIATQSTTSTVPASTPTSSSNETASNKANTNRPQRLVVAGTASWHTNLSKQVCSKQANLQTQAADDAKALEQISNGLRNGHQAGVIIASAPHATCWQAAQVNGLRPAVLSSWSELQNVLAEMPANVLIVSAKTWNIPSTANLVRHFFEHLKKQS